ncbi:MAG TPA: SDR family oxidoreductase [Candidatus Limnocylindrales bacterium]|jgi:NAD(P)-dependent dehydrogenase (short-subunit alcohol dehydrogenase family)
MQRLAGKTAIITGAASGIGRGTAEVFAEHGARLALVDRDRPGLEAARGQLAAQGAQVVTVEGDVSQAATIDGVVALALATFGQIDIVFNNAGIMPTGDLASFAEMTWDEVMDVNVKAMYLMCKAVIPHMLARGAGSIINTSSVMATLTEPGYEAYSSSKAAIMGLTRAIAVSYAEQGVRCNCICPGWVDTPLNQRLAAELGGMDKLYPIIKRQQPLGRMATTREVGYAVLFLASDESSAVTGSALYVDGAASAAI